MLNKYCTYTHTTKSQILHSSPFTHLAPALGDGEVVDGDVRLPPLQHPHHPRPRPVRELLPVHVGGLQLHGEVERRRQREGQVVHQAAEGPVLAPVHEGRVGNVGRPGTRFGKTCEVFVLPFSTYWTAPLW